MARLEGTGKDPLGRYGKGEIFDVEQYAATTANLTAEDGDRVVNPVYQELIDKGYAKPVKPEDDPGRTVTQIANHMVQTQAYPDHPVEAEIAASIDGDEYAIVHSDDPKATQGDGNLKPESAIESQQTARGQVGATELSDEEDTSSSSSSSSSSSGTGTRSKSGSASS